MDQNLAFQRVTPVGDTDVSALPVKDLGSAIGYYTQVLGFSVKSKSEKAAVLVRDDVEIGLAVNGKDPDQASCYFGVTNVEALREELDKKGIEPTAFRVDTYGGKQHRVFFAKEPYGVCFCFGQRIS